MITTDALADALADIQDELSGMHNRGYIDTDEWKRYDRAMDAALDAVTKGEALANALIVGCKDVDIGGV